MRLNQKKLLSILDIIALLGWGVLLLKYSITGQLRLLIHPNYFSLVILTGIILVILGLVRLAQFLAVKPSNRDNLQHITLFPPGWASSLLIVTAILGLIIPPQILTSEAAIQRGMTESLPVTRSQPQAFRTTTKPEERSLIDWVRTLNAYPEPDAYNGQRAKVKGFVVHLPQLPDNYLMISRFVITCCAVDAYPVGIPVRLPQSRSNYPPDTWLEIEGEMATEVLALNRQTLTETSGERQLVLVADNIEIIPTPADPYAY
jgi:putative membrane protein